MKWNWGTGIFIFLTIFILAAAAFIIFAFRQDVNLVHKNYYQQGVDYTEQMEVNARSSSFREAVQTMTKGNYLVIQFAESLAMEIDSGKAWLYRPSDSKQDMIFSFEGNRSVLIPHEDLLAGRYILKLSWYSEGLKYEVEKPVNIR